MNLCAVLLTYAHAHSSCLVMLGHMLSSTLFVHTIEPKDASSLFVHTIEPKDAHLFAV